MDLINLVIFLSAFANLFLGLLIYFKDKEKLINKVYAFLAISIFTWSFGMVCYRATIEPSVALFWCRFLYSAAIFMAGSFLYFTFVFPENKRPNWIISFGILGAHISAFFVMLFSDFLIQGVLINQNQEHVIVFASYYKYIYPPLVSLAFLWGYINLLRKRNNSKGITRYQITLVFLGAFLSSSFGMITNLILPSLGVFAYNWVGQILALIMAGCIAYAIIRYRFMDIRLIASRIYIYTLIGSFTYTVYYIFAMISVNYLGGVMDLRSIVFGGLIAFSYAIVFIPLLNKIQESSDVLFYRGYNPQRIFKDLGLRLSSVIDLEQLFKILDLELKKILGAEDINVFLFKAVGQKKKSKLNADTVCSSAYGVLKTRKSLNNYITSDVFTKNKKVIVRDELNYAENKKEARKLEKYKIEIVSPLIIRSKVIGVILLGQKKSQGSYTREDIEFLEVISAQAAVAVENALLYGEVARFNKNLRRKVEMQTRDIKEKQEKLQRLLNMRSEFLDITSHQLRTPVSVIKGVLSMLEEDSVPKARVKEFIGMAFNKSLKLEQIVDEILRASEMDSDNFELSLSAVNIVPLINEIYNEKLFIAKKNGITLKLELPDIEVMKVMSDLKYIKHVIINLVNNALQYTPKGSVVIRLKGLRGRVIIEVEDTGIGIPKKDVPKLYKKFSRADNAKETFTDGSGLGLYIIKKIIEAHKGASIKIKKTQIGKGTTMVVSLPVVK